MSASEYQTNHTQPLQPITSKDRIQVMDLLRGFALVGIIFMNIEWFNRPISSLMMFDHSQTGIDWGASWLIKVFIEGKFYKLFSVLFGMGFAVMLINAQKADRPFGAWFTRRMLALFVIGMAHMIFFWGGDILHDYAAGGMLLLGFILLLRTKRLAKFNHPQAFLKTGLAIIILPIIIASSFSIYYGVSHTSPTIETNWQERAEVLRQTQEKLDAFKQSDEYLSITLEDALAADQEPVEESITVDEQATTETENNEQISTTETTDVSNADDEQVAESDEESIATRVEKRFERKKEQAIALRKESLILSQASYWQVTQYRTKHAIGELAKTPIMAFIISLPLFMIGYWLVASKKLENPEANKGLFNLLCYGGLILGVIMNLCGVFIALHPAAKQTQILQIAGNNIFFYGQYLLCFGYIGLFVKLSLKSWFLKAFAWLAPLGKMALTNYISHSIILTSIFYGYAGGQFEQIARGEQVLIVVGILFAQTIFCHLWLSYFRFGPLEWLWRSVTYLKWQPLLAERTDKANLTAHHSPS
ncbi:DUF418 domain-containing protein [Thalassotalea sp. G2M2-11]|uniref:DUF418 domain-containing protein n=1 Tax=Thalassotalea sp. G2M2-11 TaxID=2787627 RepID=UPI0019D05390|nr:DUF418 domain-containing protein [Thalassotalea sp. G2M2-11]